MTGIPNPRRGLAPQNMEVRSRIVQDSLSGPKHLKQVSLAKAMC